MSRVREYQTIGAEQRALSETLSSYYREAAGPMFQKLLKGETFGGVAEQWKKDFATPVMEMWQETIQPMVEEGYNLPGSFYSRSKGEGVQREREQFYSQQVSPTLFSALENYRARMPQWASLMAQVIGTGGQLATAPTKGVVTLPRGLADYERWGGWIKNVGGMVDVIQGVYSGGATSMGGGGTGSGASSTYA